MTNKEAIEYNKNLRMYMKLSDKNQPCKFLEENYIALDMAIKSLNQEIVLDKIRADIANLADADAYCDYQQGFNFGLMRAAQIIDKYRKEHV
jgi:hypothetical protein